METNRLDVFLAKIEKPENGCWLWTGANNYKYGHFYYKDEIYAHRSAWLMYKGEIPKGLNVLHKCDVPLCVNPEHLFLGTHKENMQDKVKKGRQSRVTKKVEKMPINMTPIAIIKLLGGPTRIAKLVGVSVPAVSMWQNGEIPQDKLIVLAATLEKESHGLITRKNLFPNTYQLIWPELK